MPANHYRKRTDPGFVPRPPRDELAEHCLVKNNRQIAEHYGVPDHKARNWLFDLRLRPLAATNDRNQDALQKACGGDRLVMYAFMAHAEWEEAAEILGVSKMQVGRMERHYGCWFLRRCLKCEKLVVHSEMRNKQRVCIHCPCFSLVGVADQAPEVTFPWVATHSWGPRIEGVNGYRFSGRWECVE